MARQETVRLFENDLLERLSRIDPVTPAKIYLPVIVGAQLLAITAGGVAPRMALGLGAAGLFGWTLLE